MVGKKGRNTHGISLPHGPSHGRQNDSRNQFAMEVWTPNSAYPLLAETELMDHVLVAIGIVGFEVVEQAATLADQHQQTPA